MYDLEVLENLLPKDKKEVFRSLVQSEANALPNNNTIITNDSNNSQPPLITQLSNSTNTTQEIHINGNGFAGISVGILFLIPVILASLALMGTFVNTKFLDQSIRIKVMD